MGASDGLRKLLRCSSRHNGLYRWVLQGYLQAHLGHTNIMVGYHQTNQKIDTGKTLMRWPIFVDHYRYTADKKFTLNTMSGAVGRYTCKPM